MEKLTGENSTVELKGHQGGTQVLAGGANVVEHACQEVGFFRMEPVRELVLRHDHAVIVNSHGVIVCLRPRFLFHIVLDLSS